MSVFLKRGGRLVDVTIEAASGFDGQGKPSYAAAADSEAVAILEDKVVLTLKGTHVRTELTLYFEGGAAALPSDGARILCADYPGNRYVAEYREYRRRDNTLDHVRVRCARAA